MTPAALRRVGPSGSHARCECGGQRRREAAGALMRLAAALVERSADHYAGWGEVITFAACTAARIGEVSGVRKADIDRDRWIWTVRRQTTPGPVA